MEIDLSTPDRAREYLYIVAERAEIALAHQVADDDEGMYGRTLRDLRKALNAYERTHRMNFGQGGGTGMIQKRAKQIAAVIFFAVIAGRTPAHAQFSTDAPMLSLMYSEDKVYHAFMQLQIVQEIATLKANYDASVRYFNDFKQLNSGKGIGQNIAAQIKTAQAQENDSLKAQFQQTFTQGQTTSNTSVDHFFRSLDQAVASGIRYAGDEAANLISNRKTGENIAASADGLAPKDAANLSARAQGVQIQVLTQLHEDNLRLIQLVALQLAGSARQQGNESQLIDSLRVGIKRRAPGYQEPAADQGDAQ